MMGDQEKGLALMLLAGELGDLGSALAQEQLSVRLFNISEVYVAAGRIAERIIAGEDVSRYEMRRMLAEAAHVTMPDGTTQVVELAIDERKLATILVDHFTQSVDLTLRKQDGEA